MVVQVEQIREGGLTLDQPLSQSFLAQALADAVRDGFRSEGGAALHVTLHRTPGGVLLKGSTDLALASTCKRCASEVHVAVPVRFTLNLVQAHPARERPSDGADASDDLVTGHHREDAATPLVAGLVDIGVTDSAVEDVEQDVPGAGGAPLDGERRQGRPGRSRRISRRP